MLEFIKLNMSSIVVVLLIISGLLFVYKKGRIRFVSQVVLSIVVRAEKALGGGTGELKYVMVVEELYTILPSILTALITKKELDTMIEEAVQYLKQYLSAGRDLLGYEEEYIDYQSFIID